MGKQAYVKPEMERIELNSAERLAACDYWIKLKNAVTGCQTTVFTSNCTGYDSPQAVS
jgi:hypothetical protein